MKITIQCNLKKVDFLDVTFDLDNNLFKPFRKENNNPTYKNKHSNHPQAPSNNCQNQLKNEYPKTSSYKDIFDESVKPYKNALKESGFSETLNYVAPTTKKKKKIENGK